MEEDGAFKMLTGNPTGKGPLGRPRLKWEDNIRSESEIKLVHPISPIQDPVD